MSAAATHRRIGMGVLWAMLGQGAGQTLSLLLFLVIARFVSQESFGLVAVSLATVEFIRRLLFDPVALVIFTRREVRNSDYDICFTILTVTACTAAALLLALAEPIAHLTGSPGLATPLRAVTVILVALGLSGTLGARLSRNMQFRTLSLRSLFSVVVGGIVGVTMAIYDFQLWALVAQQITIQVVSVATLWLASDWWPRLRFSTARIVQNLRSARHISFSALWTFLANDIDLFLAFTFFGPAAAGVYNVGKRIMISANMILVDAISSVSLAAFANIDETTQQRTAFLTGCRLTGLFTAPAFIGLAVISDEFVAVILGPRWAEAAPILMALAISGYALSLGQFATSTLVVVNRADLDSRCSAFAAAVNVAAMFFMARFGPLALAATFSVTAMCIMPIRLSLAVRQVGAGWRATVAAIVPPLLAAVLMGGLIWLVSAVLEDRLPIAARLAIEIPLGALAYVASVRLVAPASFALMVGMVRKLLDDRTRKPIEA